jgi:glycosyltransferase involved in cell wall biosynthesis
VTPPLLLVSYSSAFGGAERVLLDWGTRVRAPVVLACPDGPLAAEARAVRLEIVTLPSRPLRWRGARVAAARALGGFARDVAAVAHARRPRLIVASGLRPVLACAITRGGPVLALHHDLATGRVLVPAVRWASGRCESAVAVSHAVADVVAPRAEVIHPGVDLERWRMSAPPPEPRALVLGALVPWKRAALALEGAARVPELHLEFVGAPMPGDPPDFAAALRARAARPDLAGRVTFTGALADPRPALERARLLLHCADREPFGLALVEAMAAGRPVVAPAAGGPAEILADGGGHLYAPGDAAAAARAVEAVLADPSAGAAARARAEAAFDGAAAARRFAAAVEALGPVGLATPHPAGRP